MSELTGLDVTARPRRRGVVKASIAKLVERMLELERKFELMHSDRLAAQRLQQKLTGLDGEFKRYHLSIVDLIDNNEDLESEQAAMDDHDDKLKVTGLFNRPARLAMLEEHEEKVRLDPREHLRKRLQHLEHNLQKVASAVSSTAEQPDVD